MLLSREIKDSYFNYIRERQSIWYKRFILNRPREEWTEDPILQKYKFCNVFRELDKGTQILLDTIIKNESLSIEQKFINILAYRFFNQRWFFDEVGIIREFNREEFRDKMRAAKEKYEIIFSTAYLIGPNVINPAEKGKLSQVTYALEYTWNHLDKVFYPVLKETNPRKLMKIPRQVLLVGNFLTYQILLDLIYTGEMKVDDNCRLFAGPGAREGLEYATRRRVPPKAALAYIDELYEAQGEYVDLWKEIYPPKEMVFSPNADKYEISWNSMQFNLCEWRKYQKLKDNVKKKKRCYNPEC